MVIDLASYTAFAYALYLIITQVPFKEGLVIFLGIYAALKLVGRKAFETG